MLSAFLSGFFLGLSLIVAIGAQNAFVLRQGLLKSHVFAVCLACAVSDAVLIAAGVSGFAGMADALPYLVPMMRYGGAAFLFVYGLRSFRSAVGQAQSLAPSDATSASLSKALATCLALTWLNPMSISIRWCCWVRFPRAFRNGNSLSAWVPRQPPSPSSFRSAMARGC